MASILKRKMSTATKPETKPEVKEDIVKECICVPESIETVTVKVGRGGPYGSWKYEIFHSRKIQEGEVALDIINEMTENLHAKATLYSKKEDILALEEDILGPEETATDPETVYVAAEKKEEESEEVADDVIRKMDRKELLKLVKDEGLEIDPKEYKKTADLAEAIIVIAFGNDAPEDEDFSEGEDVPEGEGDGDDGVSEESIREMERKELLAFIKEQELDINTKDYPKTADLAEAVIELSFADDELTPEAIQEMERTELISLIEKEGLEIDPKKYKKTSDLAEAIISELFTDDPETSEGEEGGFEDFEGFGD